MEVGRDHHHDQCQILAYCTAIHVPVGLLIYPQHVTHARTTIRVGNAGTRIAEVAVDLGGDLDQLRQACQKLAASVVRVASDELMTGLGQVGTQAKSVDARP
jgi:hypothetical protein